MTDKKISKEEQQRVEQIAKVVEMFRQIINEDKAVENNFYLDHQPAKTLDALRSWLWVPFEHILTPDEAERFKKLRIFLTDPIDVLLDVSKSVQSLEEYATILTEKFKWTLKDLTSIHMLAVDLLRLLRYDKARIEKAISIIITTMSQWDEKSMKVHRELLKIFRPNDQKVTHAEIIPMRLDTQKGRLFGCYYPWGENYAERLQDFLDDHNIKWCEDSRTAGSDCYGMLIAGPDGDLTKAMNRLSNIETQYREQFKYGTDEFDEGGYWEAVVQARWQVDFSDLNVIDIETDWKHLETDDHDEALLKVGVKMTQTRSEVLGVELFALEVM